MTETTAVIVPTGVTGVQKYDDDVFDSVASAGDYLSRIQLMTSNSEKCKDGTFPINHLAKVNGQTYLDLGDAVDALLIAWRPKAMEIDEQIITVFDTKDPEFTRIQARAGDKDSGCMYGIEFLIYVPSIEGFATFFFGSKSARKESPNVKQHMGKAVTFKPKKIETKKYTWYIPTATICSTPFEIPPTEAFAEQVEKFNNPPKQDVEKVEAGADSRDR